MDTVIKSVIESLRESIDRTLGIKLIFQNEDFRSRGWWKHDNGAKCIWLSVSSCDAWLNKNMCSMSIGDVLIQCASRERVIVFASDPNYLQKIKEAWTR